MSDEKKKTNEKYLQKLDDIKIRVPGGYRKVIQEFAKNQGYNGVNPFVIDLINEKMQEKNYPESIPAGIKEYNKRRKGSSK